MPVNIAHLLGFFGLIEQYLFENENVSVKECTITFFHFFGSQYVDKTSKTYIKSIRKQLIDSYYSVRQAKKRKELVIF